MHNKIKLEIIVNFKKAQLWIEEHLSPELV